MLNSQPQRRNTSWLREDSHDITILRLHLPIGMSKEYTQMPPTLILVAGNQISISLQKLRAVYFWCRIFYNGYLTVSQMRKDKRVNQPSANDG